LGHGDGEGGTKRLYYFKAKIKRLDFEQTFDLEPLIAAAKKIKPPKKTETVERVYFQQITDLQAGQADGSGVAGMVEKVLALAKFAQEDIGR
jgi:hypothetical protein